MFKKINYYIHKLFAKTMSTIYFLIEENVMEIYWDEIRCKEKECLGKKKKLFKHTRSSKMRMPL